MSLLIQNVYSYGISELKNEYTAKFLSFTDLSTSGKYVLNLKQKIKKVDSSRFVLENRSISGIILDSLYDLSNVFINKQPIGFNPVISNYDNSKIFKINVDWILTGNVIVTNINTLINIADLNEIFYLTFITDSLINAQIDIVSNNNKISRFGNFTSIINNPTAISNGIDIADTCVMESLGVLINTTIYITIMTKNNSTGSLLTDNTTSVTINSNKLFIKSNRYETPFIKIIPDTGYCIACVVTDNEIVMYLDDFIKKGEFKYIQPIDKKLYIKIANCIIYNITIDRMIHSHKTILNNISNFYTMYNI